MCIQANQVQQFEITRFHSIIKWVKPPYATTYQHMMYYYASRESFLWLFLTDIHGEEWTGICIIISQAVPQKMQLHIHQPPFN